MEKEKKRKSLNILENFRLVFDEKFIEKSRDTLWENQTILKTRLL